MNKELEQLIEQKNQFCKWFTRSNKNSLNINQFKVLQDEPGFLIEKSNNIYYSKKPQKFSDKNTSSKTYWPILKIFLNDKTILRISLVFHVNRLLIDYGEKVKFFNTFFVEQYSPPNNNSELPKKSHFLLKQVQVTSKSHDHGMISIWMFKVWGPYLCKSLSIISKSFLSQMKFLIEWKKPMWFWYTKIDNQCI